MREPNLGKALSRLRSENARTLSYIRLEAAPLDTGAVRGRRQRSIQIRHDGELGSTPSRPVAAGGATIGLSAVDPGAPERLVRASAKRFGYKPGGIDYLIASGAPGGGHGWVAYFKNGHYVQGDAQGRVIRRID